MTSGRINWIGESSISIADALSDREQAASRTKTARLADAMRTIVEANGGQIQARDGHRALEPEWSDDFVSEDLKTRARKRAGIRTENRDGAYWWSISGDHPSTTHRGPVTPVTHPPDTPEKELSRGTRASAAAISMRRLARLCGSCRCRHDDPGRRRVKAAYVEQLRAIIRSPEQARPGSVPGRPFAIQRAGVVRYLAVTKLSQGTHPPTLPAGVLRMPALQ